jgi:hypothetical protein
MLLWSFCPKNTGVFRDMWEEVSTIREIPLNIIQLTIIGQNWNTRTTVFHVAPKKPQTWLLPISCMEFLYY